jgi:hypothetical protein
MNCLSGIAKWLLETDKPLRGVRNAAEGQRRPYFLNRRLKTHHRRLSPPTFY